MDPDLELELLENEHRRAMDALVSSPSESADERILSVARRYALQLAERGQEPVDPGFQRQGGDFERDRSGPSAVISKNVQMDFEDSAYLQPLEGLEIRPKELANQKRPRKPGARKDLPPRVKTDRIDKGELKVAMREAQHERRRLRGMDRATWQQRIAELVLQGRVTTARFLIQSYEREFQKR